MAYGVLYEFRRTSTNGADILITISQRNYEGEVKKRSLGRAPVIKRENNGHIYGTSCELYAECLVDGELSQLYTSDAYEFRVAVYRNDSLLWMGFVSPELYSEPDVAPPYDVQIIATDGLGELKNFNFQKRGVASILDHLDALMDKTGIDTSWNVVSGLRYINENGAASYDKDILSVKIDLDHEEGNSYYDVLQNLLSSLNANITQHNGKYLIFRETDFINKVEDEGVEAFDADGISMHLPVASFGSMKSHQWWPVGQLSTVIEPAKNKVVLQAENHYKENVLDFSAWQKASAADYSEAEEAYVLPNEGSSITQTIDFGGSQVAYRLGLRVRARNVGSSTEEQNIAIKVKVKGRRSATTTFWLTKSAETTGRPLSDYLWSSNEASVEEDLATPSEADTASDAQDIDIVLPLYRSGSRAFTYAENIEFTIFNPKGLNSIYVYGVSLVKYEQIKGYEADVVINNAAREEEGEVELTMSAGDLAPAAGKVFMTGIPLLPLGSDPIKQWQVGNGNSQDYLSAIAYDYSRAIALPKMKYAGVLNVPGATVSVPLLFLRDGTYYFPKTYSYDIYNDELEVELISISAADVSLTSVIISQMAQSSGNMGGLTTSGSAGGGVVSLPRDKEMSDTSDNAVENRVIKAYVDGEVKEVADLLTSMWRIEDNKIVTDMDVLIKANLIVEGDTSSGGEGEDTPASGIRGIYVNGTPYTDEDGDGFIDLGTISGGGGVSGDYLPLAGGTIRGVSDTPLVIIGGTSGSYIRFGDHNNTDVLGYIGFDGNAVPMVYINSSANRLIHSGNIGNQFVEGIGTAYANQSINFGREGKVRMIYSTASNFTDLGYPLQYASGLSVVTGYTGWQMVTYGGTIEPNPYFRKCNDSGTWLAWKKLAFLDDNVASATKLETARTIWGQSFDGTGNVSGSLRLYTAPAGIWWNRSIYVLKSDNTTTLSSLGFYGNGDELKYTYIGTTYDKPWFIINSSGNVLIGTTTDNGQKFQVNGNVRINDNVIIGASNYEDGRLRVIGKSGETNVFVVTNEGGTTRFKVCNDGSANFAGAVTMSSTLSVTTGVVTPLLQSAGGLDIVANNSGAGARLYLTTNCFRPWGADAGLIDLGASSVQWRNVYAVNGIFSGDTSSGSDIRFKDVIKNKTLKIEHIAKAPLFTFKWNDRDDDTIHLGSSAQYWEKVCPWLVTGEDFKSLNYATLGVAIGISLAKKAVNHEERIKELEKEIKRLKEEMRYGDR